MRSVILVLFFGLLLGLFVAGIGAQENHSKMRPFPSGAIVQQISTPAPSPS